LSVYCVSHRGPTPDERRIGFGVAAEEKGGGGLMVVIDVS